MLNAKHFIKEFLIVMLLVATVLVMNYKAAQKAQAKNQSQIKTSQQEMLTGPFKS